ncbi:hypothetical protein BGZ57DRAFT_956143 [Hyaloscypha finlandica]|nr:hypothetical protein BGZ57DRAFT_956143 [Hyaloscypha finlandica]
MHYGVLCNITHYHDALFQLWKQRNLWSNVLLKLLSDFTPPEFTSQCLHILQPGHCTQVVNGDWGNAGSTACRWTSVQHVNGRIRIGISNSKEVMVAVLVQRGASSSKPLGLFVRAKQTSVLSLTLHGQEPISRAMAIFYFDNPWAESVLSDVQPKFRREVREQHELRKREGTIGSIVLASGGGDEDKGASLALRESFGSMVTATGTAAPDWTCIVPPAYCISSLTSFEIEDGNGSACMGISVSRLVRWLCLEWNCDESDVGFSGIVAVGDGGDVEEGVLLLSMV